MEMTLQNPDVASTGIVGLDACTQGGLPRGRVYLLEGDPGVGKTTLALKFLLAGRDNKEKVMLVSLAETPDEMKAVSESHGWNLSGINVFNMSPTQYGQEEEYSILQPSEIELSDTIKKIFNEVDRVKPSRVVLDSLSEIRLLAQNSLRYRRQILALKQHFVDRNCTVLLLDDRASDSHDLTLQSLVHGVIELQKHSPVFGKARRKLQVVKLRGVDFQAGFHDFSIVKGGIEVYPRLIAANHRARFEPESCPSGVPALDQLSGGGIDRGTTTLIVGPAGAGKSSLAVMYAVTAAERGEKSAIFTFDEGTATLLKRAADLKMDLKPHLDSGMIHLQQIDPAEMSPGEFMWHVKSIVEKLAVRLVVVDSLTGYLDAMPESQFLTIQMHEMLTYLNQQGMITILTMAQHGLIGSTIDTPVDVSYLADNVFLIRYFEAKGSIHKAISIVKKRSGKHEKTIREYKLGPYRVEVGPALTEFRGVLTGVPQFVGEQTSILKDRIDGGT
jgi:circadian clock protein KaiC